MSPSAAEGNQILATLRLTRRRHSTVAPSVLTSCRQALREIQGSSVSVKRLDEGS